MDSQWTWCDDADIAAELQREADHHAACFKRWHGSSSATVEPTRAEVSYHGQVLRPLVVQRDTGTGDQYAHRTPTVALVRRMPVRRFHPIAGCPVGVEIVEVSGRTVVALMYDVELLIKTYDIGVFELLLVYGKSIAK
jgi:hypothetical protein